MELFLVRHAPAEPRAEEGGTQADDALRTLTPRGRRRMRRAALGMVLTVPSPQLIATSPLVRAVETAEILGTAYDRLIPEAVNELRPGAGPDAVITWLKRLPAEHKVIAVAHEPDLSILAAVLVAGRQSPIIELKKGGACLLVIPPGISPGTARLDWLMQPRHLRSLVTP